MQLQEVEYKIENKLIVKHTRQTSYSVQEDVALDLISSLLKN